MQATAFSGLPYVPPPSLAYVPPTWNTPVVSASLGAVTLFAPARPAASAPTVIDPKTGQAVQLPAKRTRPSLVTGTSQAPPKTISFRSPDGKDLVLPSKQKETEAEAEEPLFKPAKQSARISIRRNMAASPKKPGAGKSIPKAAPIKSPRAEAKPFEPKPKLAVATAPAPRSELKPDAQAFVLSPGLLSSVSPREVSQMRAARAASPDEGGAATPSTADLARLIQRLLQGIALGKEAEASDIDELERNYGAVAEAYKAVIVRLDSLRAMLRTNSQSASPVVSQAEMLIKPKPGMAARDILAPVAAQETKAPLAPDPPAPKVYSQVDYDLPDYDSD